MQSIQSNILRESHSKLFRANHEHLHYFIFLRHTTLARRGQYGSCSTHIFQFNFPCSARSCGHFDFQEERKVSEGISRSISHADQRCGARLWEREIVEKRTHRLWILEMLDWEYVLHEKEYEGYIFWIHHESPGFIVSCILVNFEKNCLEVKNS